MKACLLFLFGLAISQHLFAATDLIPLHYRTAEDLLPTAQSIVGNDGKVSAYGNQLVVNAQEDKIRELRDLLHRLDTPPHRLLISVDTNDTGNSDTRGYRIDGRVGSGPVVVQSGADGGSQVRIIRRTTEGSGSGTQQVQTTEGYPALIQVGQRVPLITTGTDSYGRLYQNTEYQDVTHGFYVTASLTGDIVHVSISSNNDRLSPSSANIIDLKSADTHVSGRLGEWISLGSASEARLGDQSGYVRQYTTDSRNDFSLRLRIDLLE